MKPFFCFTILIFLIACTDNQNTEVKVAAMSQSITDSSFTADSLMDMRSRYELWLTQTFHSLRSQGLSAKKTWLYIDSVMRRMNKDTIPHWYEDAKQDFDSTIRQRSMHRRKSII